MLENIAFVFLIVVFCVCIYAAFELLGFMRGDDYGDL